MSVCRLKKPPSIFACVPTTQRGGRRCSNLLSDPVQARILVVAGEQYDHQCRSSKTQHHDLHCFGMVVRFRRRSKKQSPDLHSIHGRHSISMLRTSDVRTALQMLPTTLVTLYGYVFLLQLIPWCRYEHTYNTVKTAVTSVKAQRSILLILNPAFIG